MSWHEDRPPIAPFCEDEEAQRLRDLWRPSVQATYQSVYRWNQEIGEMEHRPDDYDPSQASLWVYHPMYVIPPAVASPLKERLAQLDERERTELFETFGGNWERQVLHGANRFLNRFFHAGQRGVTSEIIKAYGGSRLSTNFNEDGSTFTNTAGGFLPELGVPAPLLERQIPSAQRTIPRYQSNRLFSEDADPYEMVTEDVRREGILGWTVPKFERKTDAFVFSLFRAKNHLVSVHWFMGPAENLLFGFKYPQINRRGEEWLEGQLVELEHLLPEGAQYEEEYSYHPRSDSRGFSGDEWQNTEEQRKKHDSWVRAQPNRHSLGYYPY